MTKLFERLTQKQMHGCLDAKMHSPNNVKDYASMPPCLYASKIAFTLAEKFSPRPLRDTSQANEQRELCETACMRAKRVAEGRIS